MKKIIALAGAPNCGKTTLFNLITKSRGAVGNRPGVTVEKKYGALRRDDRFAVVDLPGAYSLFSERPEERAAGEFLRRKGADCVIVVIDGVHPEQGLSLLLEILSTDVPTVAAVNFADELTRRGGSADVAALSAALGIPCFLISARQQSGVSALVSAACSPKSCKAPQRSPAEFRSLAKELCSRCFHFGKESEFSEKLDGFLSESRFSFFCCIAAVLTVLVLAFGFPACVLTDLIDGFFDHAAARLLDFLMLMGFSETAAGVFSEGALASFGKVISFLPQLALLFFFISALEESGYLARAAFVTDKALRRFGLSGFAVIPLLLGLGCTVPAVLAAKGANLPERRRLISALPFVPCSAKLPVYAFFASALFRRSPWLFVVGIYLLSISVGAVFCFATKGAAEPLFAPTGIGKEGIVALVCGVFAKEACLSALLLLGDKFTAFSAISFVIFFTFYTPCIAVLVAIWRQTGAKTAVRIFLFQTALAYALSFTFYQISLVLCTLIR